MKDYRFVMFLFFLCTISLSIFPETGYASWYGGKFQGRLTANGETFDTNELTAAHKTLPFNTMVRVKNRENGKTVLVRINDRGPFVKGRIIDLSRAAAMELEMMNTGIAFVELEIVNTGQRPTDERKIIQIGSFKNREYAQNLLNKLKSEGLPVVFENTGNGIIRVILSNVSSDEVDSYLRKLKNLGYSSPLVRNDRIQ